MLEVDHVVLAVHDLDAAAARLERGRGLASYAGGRHPGLGTANRIVPLGSAYLELMAVVDPAADGGWAALVRAVATDEGRPALWCVRTGDLDRVAARLGLAVAATSRELPDGSTLSWRLAAVEAAVAEPALPFFIQWDEPERHPAGRALVHPSGATGVAEVEVAGDARRLAEWLGGDALPVRVVAGDPAVRSVTVAASGGAIRI